jgi:hypothetical protein
LISSFDQVTKDAKAKTERVLQEHVAEMQRRKKLLENRVLETKQKHEHTKATIYETREQMVALEEPKALCSMHSSWKNKSENKDPMEVKVEAKLKEQKTTLLRTTKELQHHRLLEKGVFTELGDQLQRLKEDLRDTSTAYAIDLMCLNQAKSSTSPNALIGSGRIFSAGSSRPQSARAY